MAMEERGIDSKRKTGKLVAGQRSLNVDVSIKRGHKKTAYNVYSLLRVQYYYVWRKVKCGVRLCVEEGHDLRRAYFLCIIIKPYMKY